MKQSLEGTVTQKTFDPLMTSFWAITGNAMETLNNVGINPLYLMNEDTQSPEGRSTCPLCELNLIHKENCTDPRCTLDKERGYDWMLDRASDDALAKARKLKLVGLPS